VPYAAATNLAMGARSRMARASKKGSSRHLCTPPYGHAGRRNAIRNVASTINPAARKSAIWTIMPNKSFRRAGSPKVSRSHDKMAGASKTADAATTIFWLIWPTCCDKPSRRPVCFCASFTAAAFVAFSRTRRSSTSRRRCSSSSSVTINALI
jgi:hypothetical protein